MPSFKRKIINRSYWRSISHPHNAKDSVIISLECGHQKRYKGSQEPQGDYAYCRRCQGDYVGGM